MPVTQADIDRLAAAPVPPQKLLIDGTWQDGQGGETTVLSPINGQKLTTTAAASAEDVARAVASARAAFEDGRWSRMSPSGRKAVLHRLADLIDKHTLELAVLGVRDNGTDIGMALKAEPGSAAGTFRYYAEALDKVYGEIAPTADNILALVHREPVGVVAAIALGKAGQKKGTELDGIYREVAWELKHEAEAEAAREAAAHTLTPGAEELPETGEQNETTEDKGETENG